MSSTRREYEMFFKITGAMGGSFSAAMRNSSSEMKALQTATRTLNSQMRDISGYQKQQKAIERQNEIIRNSETRLTELRRRNAELAQEMTNTANPTAAQRGQLERNAEQIRRCENALEEHNQRLREMQDRLGDTRVALQDAGIDTDNLSGNMERLQSRLEEISRTRNFLSNVSEELETTRAQFRDATKEFAGLAGGIGAAVGTVYASASKPAMTYESAFAGVRKTVDATEEQFAAMRQGFLSMSQNDVIASAKEIASVGEAAGQLGIQTEHIQDFSKVMIDMGESTNLSAGDAASDLAKFANITRMDQGNFDRLGSTVVDLGNNFATTEADIVSMSLRLASTGELTGLSEPQIMAAATALSSLGIEAEAGGSAMSKILKALQLAVETGDGLEDFAKVANLSQDAFKELYKQDSLKALSAFTKGLNDTERNGKSAVAILDDMGITEVRMSNAVLSLASSDDILTDAADLATKAWQDNTALAEEAEKRYATAESRIDMAKNSIENLGIVIGDMTLPAIRDLAGDITEAAKAGQRWVSENQEGIKSAAGIAGEVAKYALILKGTQVTYLGVKTGALAAAKGGAKVVAAIQAAQVAGKGKGLKTFLSTMTGLSGAGAVTAVIGGVAAAVAALTAVFVVNIKQFQQYRKEITDKKLFDNGGKSLEEYTERLKESTSEHYKYAQEVNSASEELDGIDYELSKARGSLELYNQILDENGTLTDGQADAMYEPFNEFAGKLEEDFQARYDMVFDAFKTSAAEAAQQLGISIGEIETVLDGFKNRFTTSTSDSQKTITALLDKQRNGEELTTEDWETYRKEIQFQTDMANAAPDSAKSEYEAMKEEVSGWDFGSDQQGGIDHLNELYQYASDYITEMDKAQTNLDNEYKALREQARIMHESGKSTDEEYSADITALNQAQQITYAAYKERRDDFLDEFNTTWGSFSDQIDEEVAKGMEEAGFNFFESFWNNFKGTMVTYGEQYGNLFTGKGLTYSDQQLIDGSVSSAKADEYRLAAAKSTYSGLYDAAGQYTPGEFGDGAKDPGYSSYLNSLRTSKFIPTSALAEMKAAGIPGHANGSSFTENAFIAGENGPELIVGAPGRRVFTADETSMLLGIMPQALSLAAYYRARSAPVNITVNSSFSGSSADYSAYNDDLAEKIYRIFAEKADDERRNAFY